MNTGRDQVCTYSPSPYEVGPKQNCDCVVFVSCSDTAWTKGTYRTRCTKYGQYSSTGIDKQRISFWSQIRFVRELRTKFDQLLERFEVPCLFGVQQLGKQTYTIRNV